MNAEPSNDAVYAGGLLLRALDPDLQPPEIRAWFRDEYRVLDEIVSPGMRVLDVGCGTGRHLHGLADRLGLGFGVDYEASYVAAARRTGTGAHVHFVIGDATAIPSNAAFDLAICMTNTWGTMSDKAAVLAEMRRLAPRAGSRMVSVYAPASVPARRTWYPRLGHLVESETEYGLVMGGGFTSEHFSKDRLREIVGECEIEAIGHGVGHVARF